jgi:hypothetical protein
MGNSLLTSDVIGDRFTLRRGVRAVRVGVADELDIVSYLLRDLFLVSSFQLLLSASSQSSVNC